MTGILCIDKPDGMTSFGAVARLRGITREKKAGHAGTLDPMATGVLPVLMGGATRFLEILPDHEKGYCAQFVLGMTTDTLDSTGELLTRSEVEAGRAQVEAALTQFRGQILQVPPMFSAKSRDGVRLYELARQGIEVERQAVPVTISRLELTGSNEQENSYEIEVRCSRGAYVRSLIADIGEALGCGAVMTGLRRTLAAGFTLEQCVSLGELQRHRDEDLGFEEFLIPLEQALSSYEALQVSVPQAIRFQNGGSLSLTRLPKPLEYGLYRVYSPDGSFLGIGEADKTAGELRVKRLLVRRD